MDALENNYHDKFGRLYHKNFTGGVFNAVEFLSHLTNINFHFERGLLSRLSDEALDKIKRRFRFYQYGASIEGFDLQSPDYAREFEALAAYYGKKYGLSDEDQGEG